jgi:membrane fusion protein (multidrug efflux system)
MTEPFSSILIYASPRDMSTATEPFGHHPSASVFADCTSLSVSAEASVSVICRENFAMRDLDSDSGIGGAGRTVVMEIDPGLAGAAQNVTPLRSEAPAGGARADSRAESPAETPPDAPQKKPGRRRFILFLAALAVLGGAGWYGYDWWTNGRFIVSTDDAYVGADSATIAPKVAGYIKSIAVTDNARVKAGDPLVTIDDSDFRIALSQAEAQVATAEATVNRVAQQVLAGQAQVTQANAQIESAKAAAANAKAAFDRIKALAGKAFASHQALDDAQAALSQADAAVDAANAALAAAEANVGVVNAQKIESQHALAQAKLARDQAQLNLDHTIVRAPFDGIVGNRAAQEGTYVQPGQRLMAVVPVEDVYVNANFKETQLSELVPGQEVTISVDAYPDAAISGKVESIAPASGAVFSLLPPDNATGNFTKIVQRVPVRIRLSSAAVAEGLIRPGMSVVASVDTRTAPSKVAGR